MKELLIAGKRGAIQFPFVAFVGTTTWIVGKAMYELLLLDIPGLPQTISSWGIWAVCTPAPGVIATVLFDILARSHCTPEFSIFQPLRGAPWSYLLRRILFVSFSGLSVYGATRFVLPTIREHLSQTDIEMAFAVFAAITLALVFGFLFILEYIQARARNDFERPSPLWTFLTQ